MAPDPVSEVALYIAGRIQKWCQIRLCDDGSKSGRQFCGVGKCNVFGCNCDGGCRQGNACNIFTSKYIGRINECDVDKSELVPI